MNYAKNCMALALGGVLHMQSYLCSSPSPSRGAGGARMLATVTPLSQTHSLEKIPAVYRALSLGMGVTELKEALKKDSIFGYRGERDVSLLMSENRILIETTGPHFIARSWFQFYRDRLYAMTFKLNTDAIDYYSVYENLCKKYGEPHKLSPRVALWEDASTRLVLERPLIIKYIDIRAFNEQLSARDTQKSNAEKDRKRFVQGF